MRYQKLHSSFWNDDKIRGMIPAARIINPHELFLYLMSSPHSNLVGIYVLRVGYACDDLKINEAELMAKMAVLEKLKLIRYDREASVVLIMRHLRHNQLTNYNQLDSVRKLIRALPDTPLLKVLAELVEDASKHIAHSEKKFPMRARLIGLAKELREGLQLVLAEGLPSTEEEEEEETEEGTEEEEGAGHEGEQPLRVPLSFVREYVSYWNGKRTMEHKPLPTVVVSGKNLIGDRRIKHLAARYADPVFRAQWKTIIDKAADCSLTKPRSYMRGKKRARWGGMQFDWPIENDAHWRLILEGKYDHDKGGGADVEGGEGDFTKF